MHRHQSFAIVSKSGLGAEDGNTILEIAIAFSFLEAVRMFTVFVKGKKSSELSNHD